jgi:hypothetical protein
MDESTKMILERLDKMEKKIEKKIKESEKMLLDEIQFNRNAVEKQIAKVEQNMEELKQYYRITKLENDNTALILNIIKQMQSELDELKKKTA